VRECVQGIVVVPPADAGTGSPDSSGLESFGGWREEAEMPRQRLCAQRAVDSGTTATTFGRRAVSHAVPQLVVQLLVTADCGCVSHQITQLSTLANGGLQHNTWFDVTCRPGHPLLEFQSSSNLTQRVVLGRG